MMKKYWKRLFGMLMTLCMVGTMLVPSALAMENSGKADLRTSDDEWTIVETNSIFSKVVDTDSVSTDDFEASDAMASPRAVVYNGVRLGVKQILLYPALREGESGVQYIKSIYAYAISLSATDSSMVFNITPEKLEEVLTKFKAKAGIDADAWYLDVTYVMYTDGKGSYGKYFEYDSIGNCTSGSHFRYNVSKNTATQSEVTLPFGFLMPEDTSNQYTIGVTGGFYYYSAYAKKDLSTMTTIKVIFNSAT